MGGREYEAIAASSIIPDKAGLASVLQRQVMAIPAFARGGPFAAHAGRVFYAGDLSTQERAALATLYTALMTELLLETLGAEGDTIVDGPLALNPLFGPLLAALRPSSRILRSASGANRARALCHLAGLEPPAATAPVAFEPLRAAGLGAYRVAWRDLLPCT